MRGDGKRKARVVAHGGAMAHCCWGLLQEMTQVDNVRKNPVWARRAVEIDVVNDQPALVWRRPHPIEADQEDCTDIFPDWEGLYWFLCGCYEVACGG